MAKEKKQGNAKLLVIILAIIVVVLAGGLGFYLNGISAADPGNKEEISVTVEPGSGALQILYDLDEAGLVKNVFCGKLLAKLGSFDNIQANTYVLNKDMTLTEIFIAMDTMDPDHVSQSKLIIIEGATIPQVAAALSDETGIPEKDKAFIKD